MNTDDHRTDTDAAAELATAAAAAGAEIQYVNSEGKHPFVINPHTGQPVSLSEFMDDPQTIDAEPTFRELESFTAYVSTFKREGAAIFAECGRIVAVLDYHEAPDKRNACKHRAMLALATTEALAAWTAHNGKPMTQLAFVEFLEARAKEITDPDAAAILEVAQELHVVTGSELKSCVRSGASMRIEFTKGENVRAKDGSVEVPTKFALSIPVYDDQTARIQVLARLRVRARDNAVTFTYDLEDLRRLVHEAFKETATLAAKVAGVPVFI